MLAEALLLLRPFHLFDVLQQAVEGPELFEERGREPLADPRHPGHVIDRVACQGQEVNDLVGANAPFLQQCRRVDHGILAQVENPHMIGEELPCVLVGRADGNVHPALLAAAGKGGDDVVGLHPRHHQHGHPEALENPADHGNLGNQIRGHRRPVGLVLGVDLRAEDRPLAVEGRREIVRLAIAQQVEHVPEYPEHRLCWLARRTGHLGNRMEDLKDQGECIKDIEGGSLRHRDSKESTVRDRVSYRA